MLLTVLLGMASDFACQSVWNRNSPDLAFDGDKETCYVSGLETTSWWMMTFRQATNLSRMTLTGLRIMSHISATKQAIGL